jgi:hypothetical protein
MILEMINVEKEATVFLAVESLYSMDGDFAPLPALLYVLDERMPREQQCVVVDEAHSTGVYGSKGRGITHALGEQGRISVRLMTFGKAVGCSGGTSIFISCNVLLTGLTFSRITFLLHDPILLDQLRSTVHLLNCNFPYLPHCLT